MLSKKYRIDKKLLEEVVERGKKISSPHLFIKIIPTEKDYSSFGFIVLSGVTRGAVERNKIKRRARQIVFKMLSKIKKGLAVVVFLGKGSEKLTFRELEKEINDIFNFQ